MSAETKLQQSPVQSRIRILIRHTVQHHVSLIIIAHGNHGIQKMNIGPGQRKNTLHQTGKNKIFSEKHSHLCGKKNSGQKPT
jgi:hypothetical protein